MPNNRGENMDNATEKKRPPIGRIIGLSLAVIIPVAFLFIGIALYYPGRDLYQRLTVIVTIGAIAGLIRWFKSRFEYKIFKKSDAVIFCVIMVILLYVGYCQITLPIDIYSDKPTFLNGWIWKLLSGRYY